MNQDVYYKLISGQQKGRGAALLNLLLAGASIVYSLIVRLRNFFYDKHIFRIHNTQIPVISVGNITVGGTGKTPLVIWLCEQLNQNPKLTIQNYNCAILTRGYKAYNSYCAMRNTDEPEMLSKSCPNAKVIVNPNRVVGAAEAIGKFAAKIIIMDDGFQHRRLARDLDIVTIDATRPFGYGKILPAGLLREPVTSLKRANAVVITKCDYTNEADLDKLEEKLRTINPEMLISRSIHAPVYAVTTDNKKIKIQQFKDKRIYAFCGIGNPDTFLYTIKTLGCDLIGSKIYNDHHNYTDSCLSDIYKQAKHLKTDIILTTHKDWTKIVRLNAIHKDLLFAYLAIETKFLTKEDKLRNLIRDKLAGKICKAI
jgi:tetraacyldisaccharide 4'-kinase